jgi:hypothetical protein
VVAELFPLVAEHPLREGLRELQMIALYRAGLRAEAFAVFQDARRVLDRELGIEPGPGLQEIHQRILRSDPALLAPTTVSSNDARPSPGTPLGRLPVLDVPTPAQLPADLADFTGREDIVRGLSDLLMCSGVVPVVGIVGVGGVGKSSLAIHAAHAIRNQFPDGQVYADLRGMSDRPADPNTVLGDFLRAYGVDAHTLPESLLGRAALWRTILAERRVLLVLDDARDSQQLRHLLPATPGSAAIVTSWRCMMDLPGARWIKLDVFQLGESLTLLERIAGSDRMRAEPGAARRLARLCSHHPVALRLVGARLAARPGWSVAAIEGRLLDELTDLTVAHDECEVFHAPLLRVLRRLDEPQATALRLLATPNGPDFSVAAAAAVLNLPEEQTERLLESLADAHLVEPGALGRYRYLGLVKVFARTRVAIKDGSVQGQAAIGRLARFYLATTRHAFQAMHPTMLLPPAPASLQAEGLTFADPEAASSWLRLEHDNLLAVAAQVKDIPEPPEDTLADFWPIRIQGSAKVSLSAVS